MSTRRNSVTLGPDHRDEVVSTGTGDVGARSPNPSARFRPALGSRLLVPQSAARAAVCGEVWQYVKSKLSEAGDAKQRLQHALDAIAPVRNEIAHVREVAPERLLKATVACGDVLSLLSGTPRQPPKAPVVASFSATRSCFFGFSYTSDRRSSESLIIRDQSPKISSFSRMRFASFRSALRCNLDYRFRDPFKFI